MVAFKLARPAMASRFEILLFGDDEVRLRAAAEEALDEIDRLEAQLSFYRSTSEISQINARAASEPVRVEPRLFQLLSTAMRIHEETDGAFDITVAPLMKCWGFVNDTGTYPDREALAYAKSVVGMHNLILDEKSRTVRFSKPGVLIDLGAIGKGYAIEQAGMLLEEAGIGNALIHGGTSTVYAIGRPPDHDAWKIGICYPRGASGAERDELLAVIPLENESLSVSAVWGKSFVADGKTYGHVLDPRCGEPVEGALLAACVHRSATESDALSTGLLILGREGAKFVTRRPDGLKSILVLRGVEEDHYEIIGNGLRTADNRGEAAGLTLLSA